MPDYVKMYGEVGEGARRSAEAVVPYVAGRYDCGTVIDVGCGEGHWGATFVAQGSQVTGVDGEYARDVCRIEHFVGADLERALPVIEGERFELAVCLEVAEHLSPGRAEGLVSDLCELSDVVLFSAAIPGQGGVGHVNEQWQSYWAALFEARGYDGDQSVSWHFWDDDRVENWYRQNTVVYTRQEIADPDLIVLDVVHPVLWDYHRSLR